MIKYNSDVFGIQALFVWHGSAVFRGLLPASISTCLLVLCYNYLSEIVTDEEFIMHPYVISVYILVLGYMLVFRLNYSYQRYWEAASQIHHMTSKWLDSAICLASFHYQSTQYDNQRPLTFGANPHIRNETRERERKKLEDSIRKSTINICTQHDTDTAEKKRKWRLPFKRKKRMEELPTPRMRVGKRFQTNNSSATLPEDSLFVNYPYGIPRIASNKGVKEWRASFAASRFAKDKQGQRLLKRLTGLDSSTPSLFLQEAAHLYSLLSAVAMSTLRCDMEGVESPISSYIPGLPFPPTNPDELSPEIREQYYVATPVLNFIYYFFGIQKTRKQRTLYNAARPFSVIGGISDHEARRLQQAKGPEAQMALCTMWLKEFISREYLNGSTGNVGAPIISRIYQFLSDGVNGYFHCRKIAFVPFPFVHAQATTFFTLGSLFIFPILYVGYVNNLIIASVMNFTTVLCFYGAHEVARELSDPYFTVPNDFPLNNFQVQFNEAVISMWAGFHPDSWRADDDEESLDDPIRAHTKESQANRNDLLKEEERSFVTHQPSLKMEDEETYEV